MNKTNSILFITDEQLAFVKTFASIIVNVKCVCVCLYAGPANSGQTEIQRNPTTTSVATYSLPTGTAYFYETNSGYPVAGGNLVARPFPPSSGSFAAVPQSAPTQIRSTGIATQVHG